MKIQFEKAMEGGYHRIIVEGSIESPARMYLDPDFWIALGKAEGWTCCGKPEEIAGKRNKGCEYCYTPWKDKMHRFVDHLISGKDADSFFESLLAKK